MNQESRAQADAFAAFEHDGWEQVHSGYDNHFSRLTRQSSEALLDAAEVATGMRVLDVCCGPGMISAAAAARGADPIGLDFSAAAIDIAKAAVPAAEFREGDAQDLPFEDNSFDAVICGFGIIHLPEPERALGEFYRVLKPGRRAAASVWLAPAADNGFGLLYGAFKMHGDLDVPLPAGPDFFQFSAPGSLDAALENNGFVAPVSITVEQFWEMPRAGGLLAAIVEGAVRARALFLAQTDAVRRRIEAEVGRGMASFQTDEGFYRVPMPAIVGSGRK